MRIQKEDKVINKYFKLFLISFITLFLEIVCIRWFNSNVIMLSYFSNFVLLACFLGMGIGLLLSTKETNYIVFFPIIFLILCVIFLKVIIRINVSSDISVYFTTDGLPKGTPLYSANAWWFLPVMFILTTLIFISFGQEIGKAFQGLKPLEAYIVNIFGSISGVVLFTVMSFFNSPSIVWFTIVFVSVIWYLYKKLLFIFNVFILVVALILIAMISQKSIFSPYYRIDVIGDNVVVNGVPHQQMQNTDRSDNTFYGIVYRIVKKPKRVLILGAGTGNDVAVALKNGVQEIDAVEIDPVILDIGKNHPNKPYQNNSVRIINDDARSFLKKTNKKYDMVIFALLDSLTVFSQFSSVRLENFVFTKDSFKEVKECLTDDGVVVIYNLFRKVWIIERIAKMLDETFGCKSVVYNIVDMENFAMIFNGNGIKKIKFPEIHVSPSEQQFKPSIFKNPDIKSTTDNWPFLYLKSPAIPSHYLLAILLILLFSGGLVYLSSGITCGINNHYFFLGCGFMVLETSAIIRMALLLGSTWMVNSMAIIAILIMAFCSSYYVRVVKLESNKKYYFFLLLLIIANIVVPLKLFLGFPYYVRIVLSSLLLFLPIFFSGIIFATSFNKTHNPAEALGSNLIGAMFGGCLEYVSLKFGYSSLFVVLLIAYLISVKEFRWNVKNLLPGNR